MASSDYLRQDYRKHIIDEIINGEENIRRKEESLAAFEIYKGRQSQFIVNRISQELGKETAQKSRVITSVNLTQKLVKEQSGLYKNAPEREFTGLTDAQKEHAEMLYEKAMANIKFKKANEIYKLCQQSQIMVVLKDGKLQFRSLYPHHYDAIPAEGDPEKAECYIISSFDKSQVLNSGALSSSRDSLVDSRRSNFSDSVNQKIGDPDDYKGATKFYWWTKEYNFITDHKGRILDPVSGQVLASVSDKDVANPISMLPFADVAADKDFEFYVRTGYNKANITVDIGLMLSDFSEIARLQGFSQGVISSVEQPRDMVIGPRRLMWLKKDPNGDASIQPEFQFVSPSPDLGNSLQGISNYLSMALTSEGVSPKLINAGGEKESFTSGIDRFLAGIEKFEASQDDMSLFSNVEKEIWQIVKAWNNVFYNVTEGGFSKELSGVLLPEDSEIDVKYVKPQMLLSETDKLDVIEKKRDLGLISHVEAIAIDREVDDDVALEIAKRINEQEKEFMGIADDNSPKPIVTNQGSDVLDGQDQADPIGEPG